MQNSTSSPKKIQWIRQVCYRCCRFIALFGMIRCDFIHTAWKRMMVFLPRWSFSPWFDHLCGLFLGTLWLSGDTVDIHTGHSGTVQWTTRSDCCWWRGSVLVWALGGNVEAHACHVTLCSMEKEQVGCAAWPPCSWLQIVRGCIYVYSGNSVYMFVCVLVWGQRWV